jgi:hypothetical protein
VQPTNASVGASLLAMDVNDNACFLNKRAALESFASKLAPTGVQRSLLLLFFFIYPDNPLPTIISTSIVK